MAPGQDAARLETLRGRIYRPGATDADRAAYLALRNATVPEVAEAPRAYEGRGHGPSRDGGTAWSPPAAAHRAATAAACVALLGGALALAVSAVLTSVPPSPAPAGGRSIRWEALFDAPPVGLALLPQGAGSAQTAQYFSHTPAPLLERTTFARKQFLGSGRGPTDFPLQGFDVGASRLSITVTTSRSGPVEIDLATENARDRLGTSTIARGTATAAIPTAGWGPLSGAGVPVVLRVVVPPSTRFVVRAVFLETEAPGTIE